MGLQYGSTNLADVDRSDGLGLKVDGVFNIDAAEEAAGAPFNPNPRNGLGVYENALLYGLGRWIDNGFSRTPRIGNFDTGGGAGNSGKTYTNTAAGTPQVASPSPGLLGGVSPLLLIGGAVLLAFVLARA